MTKPRDPEALLSAYLADGMEVLPDRVVDSVLDEVHRTRQRAVFGPWRTRSMSRTTLAAAVVVAVVALGGAFFVIQRGQPAIGGPSPSASASASASQPAVVARAPRRHRAPRSSPSPVAQSLELTWTKVALDRALAGSRLARRSVRPGRRGLRRGQHIHRRRELAVLQPGDPDPGYVELLTGRSFASWEDDIVGWWNPEDGPDYREQAPGDRARHPADRPTTRRAHGDDALQGPHRVDRHRARRDRGPGPLPPRLGRLGRLQAGRRLGLALRGGELQGRDPRDHDDSAAAASRSCGRTRASSRATSRTRASGGTAPMASSGRDARSVGPEDVDRVSGSRPASATSWACRTASSRAGSTPKPCPSPDGCAGMWHSSDGLTWRNLGNVRRNGSDGSHAAVDGRRARHRRGRALRLLDLAGPQRAADGRGRPGGIEATERAARQAIRHGTARRS